MESKLKDKYDACLCPTCVNLDIDEYCEKVKKFCVNCCADCTGGVFVDGECKYYSPGVHLTRQMPDHNAMVKALANAGYTVLTPEETDEAKRLATILRAEVTIPNWRFVRITDKLLAIVAPEKE